MLAPIEPVAPDGTPIEELLRDGKYREATALCAAEHGPSVGRLCMAMLGNPDEAEEVAQETFLAAYRGMASFRAEGSLRSWIFGIARRQCARRLERGPKRHLELVADEHESDVSVEADFREHRRSRDLRKQLSLLKPSERDVLLLRFVADLDFREVAAALDLTEVATRKRASRALLRLRTLLQREDIE